MNIHRIKMIQHRISIVKVFVQNKKIRQRIRQNNLEGGQLHIQHLCFDIHIWGICRIFRHLSNKFHLSFRGECRCFRESIPHNIQPISLRINSPTSCQRRQIIFVHSLDPIKTLLCRTTKINRNSNLGRIHPIGMFRRYAESPLSIKHNMSSICSNFHHTINM